MKFFCVVVFICALGLQVQAAPAETDVKWGLPKVPLLKGAKPVTSPIKGQIVGGSLAKLGQYPFQAHLHMDSSSVCGGSLIASQWVLTAAHCLYNKKSVVVRLGTLNWRHSSEPSRVTQNSTLFYIHPQYNNTNYRNDVALIKLPTKVCNTAYISTIKLATENSKTYAGFNGSVSGWGRTSDTSDPSSVLYGLGLPIITNSVCENAFGSTYVINSTLCTSSTTTKAICNGDSGGPLTVMDAGVRKQVGVVSFGTASCVTGYPLGYARVTSFVPWISQIMNINAMYLG